MDPNETLQLLRALAAKQLQPRFQTSPTGHRMAELFQELDEWLTKGGFLPEPWARDRHGL